MKWISVLEETRLPEGGREVVHVKGTSILLLRHQGQLHAVAAHCPHMGAPLQNGRLTDDGAIVCPWHRKAFDLRTGDVRDQISWLPSASAPPGVLRQEQALPVFAAKVENGNIWVAIEE